MKSSIRLLVAFICGVVACLVVQSVLRMAGDWRTVQVITTEDGSHTAELRRLYGYIDVNFEVRLDGERVYRSADFSPSKGNAFRERITWDTNQDHLVFLVAEEALFGCAIADGVPRPTTDLQKLSLPPRGLRELGYEGENK